MKNKFLSLFLVIPSLAFSQNEDFHLDKDYAVSKNGTIDLYVSDAEVFITGSARSATAHIKIDRTVEKRGLYKSSGEFRVDIRNEGSTLTIRENHTNVSFGIIGYSEEHYKIAIEAPEGSNLVLKSDDSKYIIKNINGSISIDFDDGDAQLFGCNGSNFSFRLDDGSVKMDSGKGNLNVVSNDATVEIRNANFSSINARFDDGDFLLQTSIPTSAVYSINTEDGLIAFDILNGGAKFSIHHDDSSIDAEGAFTLLEETDSFTKLFSGHGKANVSIRADDATIKLFSK